MDPDFRGDTDHHDGTSDATPGGYPNQRRPGELVFACLLLIFSLFLLTEAYGISGFGKLSSPGTVPMATAAIMVLCMVIVVARTMGLPRVAKETLLRDIVPFRVMLFAALLVAYALALRPIGFVPTTAVFLIAAIRLLGRGWLFSFGVGLGALIGIWLIFRLVFTVLMPAGIFPEAELVQFFRTLFGGPR
jgi:putative tricarboxylic transport membrane protein